MGNQCSQYGEVVKSSRPDQEYFLQTKSDVWSFGWAENFSAPLY